MAEPDGYSPFDKEGTVAADFPDDFKEYVDTQLNCCPVVYDDTGKDIFCGWVFWSREDDQSEHPPILFPGFCGYRMISKDYKFYMDRENSDEQLGVPGRVFKHGFPEFTSNIEYYSIEEYPLRDHALRCQVKLSSAIPLFDLSTHLCVGVLEIVSTTPSTEYPSFLDPDWGNFHNYWKEVGLESSISVADHCKESVSGTLLLGMVNVELHLRKGQGVVGRAFYSPNVLLCKDVTQLSIIDYPLAHYARDHKLGCCFAICLQSSCTGNDVYVLECFMQPSNKDYYANQQTGLRKILETMKKNFLTFKLASGEELGGHLYIEEIPFQNGERIDSVQVSQTTKSLSRLEPLQSGGEMSQLDLLNQQSMDALNNGSNVVSAERSNIDVTCLQEKGKTKRPKRVHNKTGVKIEIPLDDILQNSKKSIEVAADNLQVGRSTLKRVCRGYGFPRWPPPLNLVNLPRPFSQVSAIVVHANPCTTVIRDANIVTVKAKYINDIIIKFPLSLSSGLVELQQQIANRLHLEDGTYYVKYKDEDDDLIVIACDQDLQDYISSSTSPGSTTIMVFIVPK
ncbi:hypothetical protein HYC85_029850 [Camellia sinensis]|uniref:PB1 domain-containing protein n=1 Tax=Camellia sinensis TaxID=4442 RepID=A0A7J7FZ93_CAMSI|nr:hypothetical protein HYC85_029850 [Camellia sinensis]